MLRRLATSVSFALSFKDIIGYDPTAIVSTSINVEE